MKKYFMVFTILFFGVFLTSNCAGFGKKEESGSTIKRAVAIIEPTEGNHIKGTVVFTKTEKGIKVAAHIEGLTPGLHGFDIHQYGDCRALDASSAGGHFNPDGNPHGGPNNSKRHVGDLGNLEADENGNARYEWVDDLLSFSGKHSIIGRSVIIHSDADDLTSQPTGSSDGRVACGVIGIESE
jgi:Cu-Zn family superoxide dismutase